MNRQDQQKRLCEEYRAEYLPTPDESLVVVDRRLLEPQGASGGFLRRRFLGMPQMMRGMRHPPDTTDDGQLVSGWWIWFGDKRPRGFEKHYKTVHAAHLPQSLGTVVEFLGLAPGWSFMINEVSRDVWWDDSLLDVDLDYFSRRGLPTPRATEGQARMTYGRILGLP